MPKATRPPAASSIYTCAGCHGVPGYTNAYPQYPVPKIAGQNEQYIINALHGYQSGDRKHPTMGAQAQSLSDTDIQNIAAYLSSLAQVVAKDFPHEACAYPVMSFGAMLAFASTRLLANGNIDANGKKKAATCFACHGVDGNAVDPQYPRLAGQYNLYLQQVLHEYKDGHRDNEQRHHEGHGRQHCPTRISRTSPPTSRACRASWTR